MNSQNLYGWAGSILHVNLDKSTHWLEPIDGYLDYIGGRGVSDWILFRKSRPSLGATDPQSPIILGTGPLTGTVVPAACRLNVSCKSVTTGGMSTSNVGGHFAPELKYAGIDIVVITGKAPEPVYLFISNNGVEIRTAKGLWGKTTWETEEAIRNELRDEKVRVACIGPAGENLCAGACIIVDRSRAAGWGGCGAVLGSKNLKAIAVRGVSPVRIADPEGLWENTLQLLGRVANSRASRILIRYGTHGAYGVGGPDGKTPQGVRNHQDEYWPAEKGMNLRELVFKEKWEIRRTACFSCPTSCSHIYRFLDEENQPLVLEGIHTNTVRALGSNLDIADPAAIIKGQALINQLGLNSDAVGSVLGWAYEAFERGLLTENDTGGLKLTWGNSDAMLKLITQIAYRQGIGDLLADGVKKAALTLGKGSEEFAMHIKGQELNEQTVRSHKGWALGIFTSTRGGGHLNGASLVERLGMDKETAKALFGSESVADPAAYEGKGSVTAWFEKFKAIVDSMGICHYQTYWIDLELIGLPELAQVFEVVTGKSVSADTLLDIGARIHNVEKAFNTLHAGFGRCDDYPPSRFFELPISGGPYRGAVLERDGYDLMLDEYYRAHGWDTRTGWQTRKCLEDLGLADVAAKLREVGRLPG